MNTTKSMRKFVYVFLLLLLALALVANFIPQIKAIYANGCEDFEDISDMILGSAAPSSNPTQSSEQAYSGTYSIKVNTTDNKTGASYVRMDNRHIGDFFLEGNEKEDGYMKYTIFIYTPSAWTNPNNKSVILYEQLVGGLNHFIFTIDVDGNIFWANGTLEWNELRQADNSSFQLSDDQWHNVTIWHKNYLNRFKVWIDTIKASNWTAGIGRGDYKPTAAPTRYPRVFFGDYMPSNMHNNHSCLIYYDDFYINKLKVFGRTTKHFDGLETLTKYSENPLDITGGYVQLGDILYFVNGYNGYEYWMYYLVNDAGFYLERSNDGITFTDSGVSNPLITRQRVESTWGINLYVGTSGLYCPEVIIKDNIFYMFWSSMATYADIDVSGFIGMATSTDGLNWTIHDTPVLEDDELFWELNPEDWYKLNCPSVIYYNDVFNLFYDGAYEYLFHASTANPTTTNFSKTDLDGGDPDPILLNTDPSLGASYANTFIWNNIFYHSMRCVGLSMTKGSSLTYPHDWIDMNNDKVVDKVVAKGSAGEWDDFKFRKSSFLILNGDVKVYYTGFENASYARIGLATGTANYSMCSSNVHQQRLDGIWYPVVTFFEGEMISIANTNGSITYADWQPSLARMTFNISAPSGNTSVTEIYCGEGGQPEDVIGATSWSYNSTTRMATVQVTHTSEAPHAISVHMPAHDIAVINLTASPTTASVGQLIYINVTVENQGDYTETFNVSVYYTRIADPLIGTQTVTDLLPCENRTLTFEWTPNMTGRYKILANTTEISSDIDPTDNTRTTTVYVKYIGSNQGSYNGKSVNGFHMASFIFAMFGLVVVLTTRKNREMPLSNVPASIVKRNLRNNLLNNTISMWQDQMRRQPI